MDCRKCHHLDIHSTQHNKNCHLCDVNFPTVILNANGFVYNKSICAGLQQIDCMLWRNVCHKPLKRLQHIFKLFILISAVNNFVCRQDNLQITPFYSFSMIRQEFVSIAKKDKPSILRTKDLTDIQFDNLESEFREKYVHYGFLHISYLLISSYKPAGTGFVP